MKVTAELLWQATRALETASCQNPEMCCGQWKENKQPKELCPRCRALYEINRKLQLANQEVQP